MLKISDLRKKYSIDKTDFFALNGISVEFPSVQFVSVLGPSGCGKTTFLNCIGGLDNFSSGEIEIDGRKLSEMSEKELDSYRNNYIGFVFQNYYLIPQLSVLDNVKIALEVKDCDKKEVERRALSALKRVGLLSLKNKRPNQLSGGQAQRVAIARALINEPNIILADEPTGALDSQNSILIMDLLKELSKDHLIIMVTHNEELAKRYSDRILSLKDGCLIHDETLKECSAKSEKKKELKKSKLAFSMSLKLSFKNVLSRKWKTVLTGVANSFGMIGIGFFLAINHGFSNYSSNLSSASATSLPVVVSAYNQKSESEKYADKNASALYPDVDEIYPKVDLSSQVSYTYNHFSPKYFSYLDSLVQQGIIREYISSYGNDYSFNLATKFPSSLNGSTQGGYSFVDTSTTNYNYYAYQATLPYNIFHVLYGDLEQYDLICGTLPQKEEELVLVVDKYNSVSFQVLQKLGFYNSADTKEDIEDENSKSKVKPIKFEDVLSKTYRVFTNDEVYQPYDVLEVEDGLSQKKKVTRYSQASLDEEFVSSHGKELKISGIIRPKQTSPFTILSPALCYLPSLQDTLMKQNENSNVAKTIYQNLVFQRPGDLSEDKGVLSSFLSELQNILEKYQSSESKVLPTSDLNSVFNKYFAYYPFVHANYRYIGFSTFLKEARTHGADLVSSELLGKDLSDSTILEEQLKKVQRYYLTEDFDNLYKTIISMLAYSNAYSEITSLVIFPVDLAKRSELIAKLDEFNTIDGNSSHALSEEEKVYYVSAEANAMLEDVGEMISLVSTILIIFAAVSLVVSSSMTALLTSNNVLERRKEIGLLRSLGSKKSDVVRLFEIESFMVGSLAGIIGSLMTFSLSFPINYIINYYYSYYNVGTICDFTFYHALIVFVFSVVIGLISSLIPALKASRENPVDALRSE